jgi:hypothetical protein
VEQSPPANGKTGNFTSNIAIFCALLFLEIHAINNIILITNKNSENIDIMVVRLLACEKTFSYQSIIKIFLTNIGEHNIVLEKLVDPSSALSATVCTISNDVNHSLPNEVDALSVIHETASNFKCRKIKYKKGGVFKSHLYFSNVQSELIARGMSCPLFAVLMSNPLYRFGELRANAIIIIKSNWNDKLSADDIYIDCLYWLLLMIFSSVSFTLPFKEYVLYKNNVLVKDEPNKIYCAGKPMIFGKDKISTSDQTFNSISRYVLPEIKL